MPRTDVIDFIVTYVESIEQLEVLLLLHEHKQQEWTVRQVNEIIRSSESSIVKQLAKWLHADLLKSEEKSGNIYYRYSTNPELDAIVEEVAEFYRDRRVTAIECIYSKSLREIRNFSDAFKVKKKEE